MNSLDSWYQHAGVLTIAGVASDPSPLHDAAGTCDALRQDEGCEHVRGCLVGACEVVVALAGICDACVVIAEALDTAAR